VDEGMTVWDIAHLTSQDKQHFEIHTGNFLDEFYRSEEAHRKQMIEKEPDFYENLTPRNLPFLAGMVEKLCNDHHLECPAWVHKCQRESSRPFVG
jgi:hypothetical protein